MAAPEISHAREVSPVATPVSTTTSNQRKPREKEGRSGLHCVVESGRQDHCVGIARRRPAGTRLVHGVAATNRAPAHRADALGASPRRAPDLVAIAAARRVAPG